MTTALSGGLLSWALGSALVAAGLVVWPDRRAPTGRPGGAVAGGIGLTGPRNESGAAIDDSGGAIGVGKGRGVDGPGDGEVDDSDGPEVLVVDVVRVMVLVAACLRSGAPTGAALDQVAEVERAVVAADLRQVSVALAWGMPDGQAWAGVSRAWAPLADALELAREAGIPAYGTLTTAAEQLRRELAALHEERAARAQVLLVLPLTLAYLPAFVFTTIVPVLVGVAVTLTVG